MSFCLQRLFGLNLSLIFRKSADSGAESRFFIEIPHHYRHFWMIYSWNKSSNVTFPCMAEEYLPGFIPLDVIIVKRTDLRVPVFSLNSSRLSRIHST